MGKNTPLPSDEDSSRIRHAVDEAVARKESSREIPVLQIQQRVMEDRMVEMGRDIKQILERQTQVLERLATGSGKMDLHSAAIRRLENDVHDIRSNCSGTRRAACRPPEYEPVAEGSAPEKERSRLLDLAASPWLVRAGILIGGIATGVVIKATGGTAS